jgi:transcription elongation factor Elf1
MKEMEKENNNTEYCPMCDQKTLHVYTSAEGEFIYCESCGLEMVLDEIKN